MLCANMYEAWMHAPGKARRKYAHEGHWQEGAMGAMDVIGVIGVFPKAPTTGITGIGLGVVTGVGLGVTTGVGGASLGVLAAFNSSCICSEVTTT